MNENDIHAVVPEESLARGHEQRDASFWGVAIFGIALTLVIVVVQLGLVGLLRSYDRRAAKRQKALSPLETTSRGQLPAPPLLEGLEPVTADAIYGPKHAQLNSYYWLNRDQRVARIPIDRAMGIVVEQLRVAPDTSPQKEDATEDK